VPVRTHVEQVGFTKWDSEHPAAAGLHTKDFKLEKATVFEAASNDGRVGEVQAGPRFARVPNLRPLSGELSRAIA
jgi:hypothetical protein